MVLAKAKQVPIAPVNPPASCTEGDTMDKKMGTIGFLLFEGRDMRDTLMGDSFWAMNK